MINAEFDKVRAEITGMKAVLYSLCAVQPPEQARLFQILLQRQLDSIEENLSPSEDAREFMERTVGVIQDFILVAKKD
ncbi:hypothetical protein [Herbaspirillum rhizosphaerae]|uniref:hypothetical protein n=1 Tax=Herbaspirillum rhizosphaerae TaxID=346179 RepID=UPI00067D13F8|nr:hypothetical protein [Herbaspirillum rhizosphaerae]